jgi:hypothetical protein
MVTECITVSSLEHMQPNGPAIWGGCVTRRSIRAESWYPEYSGPESCHGARRVRRSFCRPGTKFVEHYACRGTSLNGAASLSPVTKLGAGTGAVSRDNLSRSQKFVKVQDLNCVQMRALPNVAKRSWVSGCNGHYKSVLRAGAKAKSVTNNLPILSVLALDFIF